MSARPRRQWSSILTILWLAAACGMPQPSDRYDPEVAFVEGAPGVVFQGMNVDAVTGCSTSAVAGLSRQLVDGINCLRPSTLVDIHGSGVSAPDTVWAFLQAPARDGLSGAIRNHGGTLTVNSALRTLAQQYLLYRWYQLGQCSISLAARPGRSSHESGLALDINDSTGWRSAMESNGYTWLGSSDPVHFDFTAGGTVELSGYSVRAFQELWNLNHPEDVISADGAYGPQTEARLKQSPAEGFPMPLCEPSTSSSSSGGGADGGLADLGLDPLLFCGCGAVPADGAPWAAAWLSVCVAAVLSRQGRRA